MPSDHHFPVAIVGISAEFPSGNWNKENIDYNSFYEFLLRGREAYEKIPQERFNIHTLKGTASGQVVTDTGAFLKHIGLFDPNEFGITNKDARLMNLGTRKLLEITFLALIDSGINYRGRNIGCYMSAVAHDMFSVSGHDDTEARGAFSGGPAMIANRVSYHLDLRGPSIPVDTACSSTLYATHLAVQALRNGECEAAVVGGCQLNHRFSEWLMYTQGGILSPDGKCKPFDASADGFGRGEAAVSIVLKPLDSALRDRDKIYAAILGTGVSSSGSLAPVNAPVASAQYDAMRRAFAQALRSPKEVDFIELHATGTASGDPTEANWVGAQFKRDAELVVGSVKGNIGHTEIAAFLASLCKVCHILEHGVIPPTVNFSVPNPAIRWAEYSLRVPDAPEMLGVRSPSGRALISMSSSGIGGANGHCVIEAHPSNVDGVVRMWSCDGSMVPSLLIAGGLSPRSASAVANSIKSILANQDRARMGRALGRRARSMQWKAYSVTSAGQIPRFSEPVLAPKVAPEIIFVFSGQGPQHWNMGRELFRTCAPFHDTLVELDAVFASVTGKSLITDIGLFGDLTTSVALGDVWPISVTLPALTALQIALVDTLSAIGVKPDVLVGHSAGETAVMYASGAVSKAMALELSIARGRAMQSMEAHDGAMAAVACSAARAKQIIAEVMAELGPAVIEVGCFNAPNSVTLSGSTKHILFAVQRAKEAGILATQLRTQIPVHSSMMSLCQMEYQGHVGEVFKKYVVRPTKVETFSAFTGGKHSTTYDAQYSWGSTLGPVMFDTAVEAVHAQHPHAVFVEIGPHPVLSAYITATVGQGVTVLSPLKWSKSSEVGDLTPFLDFIGRLVCMGYSGADMDVLYGTAESRGVGLPPYPFARKEIPYVAPTFEIARQRQARNGPLNYPQLQINMQTHPGLAEHVIMNEPIMPAAGFLEMALEFGAKSLWDVQFHSMLPLSSERPLPVDVKLEGSKWSICSAAAAGDFTNIWPPTYNRVHAAGYLSMDCELDRNPPVVPLDTIRQRLKKLEMKGFYNHLSVFANYGPTYRRVLSCYHGLDASGREELLVEIRGSGSDLNDLSEYRLHPAILDAALHVSVHPLITGAMAHGHYYLPSKIGTLVIHDTLAQGIPEAIYAYCVFVKWTQESLTYDFKITNEHGVVLCTIEALEVAVHGRIPLMVQDRYEVAYRQLNVRVSEHPNTGSGTAGVDMTAIFDGPQCVDLQVFRYSRGHEMSLQQAVRSLDPSAKLSLCFVASEDINGDAILGFTRSLRKEYQSWRVYCVVFPTSQSLNQCEQTARSLCGHPLAEEEMLLHEDGSVYVSRLVSSSAPKRTVTFNPADPWVYRNSTLWQAHKSNVPSGHVLVHVLGTSNTTLSCRTFIGCVDGSTSLYLGITFDALSNYILAHRGSLLKLGNGYNTNCGPHGIAAVIAVLAIGHSTFKDPSRFQDSHVLVTHADTGIGNSVCQLYKSRGLRVVRLMSQASVTETRAALSLRPKVVVSGRQEPTRSDVDQIVHRLQTAKMFQWDDPETGLARILREDPWAIGDALELAISEPLNISEVFSPPLELLVMAPPDEVPSLIPMFDPEKAYILVGGVGALGMHIAHWMYKNGAREIILTSRSGTAHLVPKEEFVALRILRYLRSQDDLVLRTEAIDASSIEQTTNLVATIKKPIGGCMIMTAILIDRTFVTQTVDTFEAAFVAKTAAFETLEKAIDINSLDFLLAFSSVAGLLGNAGQTNYSSANTALTGLTRRYRNAATIVPPMINDTGIFLTVAATDSMKLSRLRHLISWAMTSEELCEYIGDALMKLREGPLWQYVPNFDWSVVQRFSGPSPLFDHLVIETTSTTVGQVSGDVTQRSLSDIICEVLDIDAEDISPDVPLTSYGLDSLSATALSHALEPYMKISQLQLLADVTLDNLEHLRVESSRGSDTVGGVSAAANGLDSLTRVKVQEMVQLLQKYSSDLPSRNSTGRVDMDKVVFLTGATGSIGSQVLAHLLRDCSSTKIMAIVRRDSSGATPMDRLLEVFNARNLDVSALSSHKLTVWEGDISESMFGLPSAAYEELLFSVTHVIHLAWPIELLSQLSSFELAIRGVRNIIDFAVSSEAQVKLLFASTTGMIRKTQDGEPAPEMLVEDPSVAVSSGYYESKWVAERLITLAVEKNICSSTIVRICQLSGSVNGTWRVSEWVPSMVSASIALGCLPDASGNISWLPVDVAAVILVEFMASSAQVLHLSSPRPVAWSEVFSHFATTLGLPLVPYADWITRLELGLVSSGDVSMVRCLEHGLRLLDVFRFAADPNDPRPDVMSKFNPQVDITHGLEVSTTLRDRSIREIGLEEVSRWVNYWRVIRFIPFA